MARNAVDVVVAGHICLDITPAFLEVGGESVEQILKPGWLVIVGPATISTGGAVSNTGLALRRLGVNVALMGKCADDSLGHTIIERLRHEAPGAEKGMAIVKGDFTSYTVVFAPPAIDRIFLHCPGANDTFTAADINMTLVKQAKLFHFGYPPLMKRMYSDGGRELERIFKRAKDAGATTSLDMALPDPCSPAGRADWKSILKRVLPHVDIFEPSCEELLFMLNRPRFDDLRGKAGTGEMLDHFRADDIACMGGACLTYGAKIVLIKCGKLGAYVRTAGIEALKNTGRAQPQDLENWGDREIWRPSYTIRKIASAAGAGDTAIAGFLAGYLNKASVEATMRYCCAAGFQNLHAIDTVSGIRTWKETTAMIGRALPVSKLALDMTGWRYNPRETLYAGPADRRRRSQG